MDQNTVNLILGLSTIIFPTLGFVLRDWWKKRKGTAQFGTELVDAMTKTSIALKDARSEITLMSAEMLQMDKKHEGEIQDLIHKHKRDRTSLTERIQELEKRLIKYDVSFTLTTHPDVRVDNIRVTGSENLLDSHKIKAITPEDIQAHKDSKVEIKK
jgi:hypothetical protein